MRPVTTAFALAFAAAASPSLAQERVYCPARPGLGTAACTIEPGRVSVEIGIANWQRDDEVATRTGTLLLGDTLVRIGVSDTVEAVVGWTSFGQVRTRDKVAGSTEVANSVGDVLVGVKANLKNPDGSGFSIAVQPFALLPVGREPIGAGDWSMGVIAPMSYDLTNTLNLQFSPQINAATDEDGSGRHLAYSATVGLDVALTEAAGATVEIQAARDEESEESSTSLLAGISGGWLPSPDQQVEVGANFGINRAAPDIEIFLGYARLF